MHYQPKLNILENRIILVTGASDGIGREVALTYASYGAHVILLGRNAKTLHNTKQAIDQLNKTPACLLLFDLEQANPKNCKELAEKIAICVPHLDGVLHNASILGDLVPLVKLNPTIWNQVIQINLHAVFYLTQVLIPLLLKSKAGSLIFTTSSVGRIGRASWGAYSVSKFAIEGMMQVLADEYKNCSLRVNCINPGSTRTKMRARAFPQENSNLLKRPIDLMPIYLYLMSDDSRYKTGISFDAQPKYQNNIFS
ncbi:YciK family oxidoreductase [Pantoea sp. Aalb]|uniref:YciK family oxidoreductase n=1 Tax=Pantoea sp. Aalb TaxID=2576762 RepID=UPI0013221437|nr:YciK family oxidoreductase [Pantoea sp. Aalb]MXP67395.1 YciK family oxidoreductase [Pantoea sp. Aalb]